MKKINEVSKLSGVTKRTLQYYDNEGLMSVHRSELNYRMYNQDSLERIWEILICREIGFELIEIKELQTMREKELEELLEQKLEKLVMERETVDVKIKFLGKIINEGFPPICFGENKTKMTYVEMIRGYQNSLK